MARLEQVERLEFISLFDDARDRAMVVAFFLALLELIRRGAGARLAGRRLRSNLVGPPDDVVPSDRETEGGGRKRWMRNV